MSARAPRRTPPLAETLLGLLLLLALSGLWRDVQRGNGLDFYQYWVVGRALAEGEPGDLYSDAARRRLGARAQDRALREGDPHERAVAVRRGVLQTFGSPFHYALYRGTASLPYEQALALHRAASLAAFLAGVAAAGASAGLSWGAVLAVLLFCALWFAPLAIDLRVGNVNGLQLGLVGAACAAAGARRPLGAALAGASLVLAVLLKPNALPALALLIAAWVLGGAPKRLLAGAVGIALAASIAGIVGAAGVGDAGAWIAWPQRVAELRSGASGNFALSQLLRRHAELPWTVLLGGFTGAVSLLAVWRGLRASPDAGGPTGGVEPAAIALGALVALMAPKMAWAHYFVLALPAALLLLGPRCERRPIALARAAVVCAVLLAVAYRPAAELDLASTTARAWAVAAGVGILWLGLSIDLAIRSPGAPASRPGAGTGGAQSDSTVLAGGRSR